nr:pitrilysin family protein [uncultured Holophaga sp.]
MTRIGTALAFTLVSGLVLEAATPPTPAPTGQAQATPVKVATVEGITEYRLANGLRVLLFPDPGKPTITVNITYMVGSRNENYGETGMAHLLEHMVFKGTPHHPDIPKELTEHGTRPNGSTWYDRTNYFETFQASPENLEWALDLEADRMINSWIAIDPEKAAGLLKTEMTVVRNEFEMGENNPMRVLQQRVMEAAYDWHNYGKPTIGARSDIENVDIHRLSAFFRTYYQPDNAVLLVAGRIDEARTLELIQRKFGAIPRPTRVLQKTYTREPVQDGERLTTVRRKGDFQAVMAGYHLPPGSHPDFAPLAVLAQILGDTPTGRLHKSLVDTKEAVSVFAWPFQLQEPSYLLVGAQVRTEAPLDRARQDLLKELEDPSRQSFTQAEVDRARQQLMKEVDLALNDADRVGLALSEYIALGDWRLFFLDRDRVQAVSATDVDRVAKAYLKPANRTLGLFIPEDHPDRAEIPQETDVEAMVKDYKGRAQVTQGEAFDPSPAAIEKRAVRFTTPAGLRTVVIPKKTRGGSVAFTLDLHFGSEATLRGRDDAGSLVPEMLLRGSARLTRAQIADRLDQLKAQLTISGDDEGLTVRGETVAENLPELLRLVTELLREPAFPKAEFDTLREKALSDLEAQRSEPTALGSLLYQKTLSPYPKGHPRYVPDLDEQLQVLKGVELEDLKRFHHDFYGAGAGELAVVGAVDPAALRPLVDELLGTWKSPIPYTRMPRVYRPAQGGHLTRRTPDKANAFFAAGLALPLQETDPDYPALVMGNFMLGGGFLNSRLATRIRQKEGLSYGVGSQLQASPQEAAGAWTAYAIFAPQNAGKLERAFHEELERALKEGFTQEELDAARKGWLQSRQVSRAQDRELASTLASLSESDRTLAFSQGIEDRIRSLTPTEVTAALRKHLDPSRLLVVEAGDFKTAK